MRKRIRQIKLSGAFKFFMQNTYMSKVQISDNLALFNTRKQIQKRDSFSCHLTQNIRTIFLVLQSTVRLSSARILNYLFKK